MISSGERHLPAFMYSASIMYIADGFKGDAGGSNAGKLFFGAATTYVDWDALAYMTVIGVIIMDAGTIMVMCCNSIAASRSFGSRIAHDRPFRDSDAESALSGGISGIKTCHGQLNVGKAV